MFRNRVCNSLSGFCGVHDCIYVHTLVYMYILLFVCFHISYISYTFKWTYGRLVIEVNMSPS